MQLVIPAREHLDGYVDALRQGWSANTMRPEAAAEDLARIDEDADAFLAGFVDREGAGPPLPLSDGSVVPRLPGVRLWMWDEEGFCGSIGLRWQPGTTDLPPHCLGHIGYAVVPWKQRRGYATAALGAMLPLARDEGLPFVDLVTDLGNTASQKVIAANGGVRVKEFTAPASLGSRPSVLFRISLVDWPRAPLRFTDNV